MPYQLSKQGGKTCVVNQDTGKVVPGGCHSSRADALKHMRALYANVPDAVRASVEGTPAEQLFDTTKSGGSSGVSPLIAAAAAPLAPPLDWFNTEEPDHPEPLTVEADGRVHGHLALWDACHVGLLNGQMAECVKPPHSQNSYQSFHLGQLETDDGTTIPVGKIVYNGSHASLTSDLVGATQHYDKTGSVAAYVRARDGKHGIYLSGTARSDLSPEGLRDLRANPPSGDWRGLRGRLEMIAALAVPIPGYQTPQMALTASGDVATLILPGYCAECFEEEDEMDEVSRSYIRERNVIAHSLASEPPVEPVVAAVLTSKRRKQLAKSAFAVPSERKFPIHDRSHAQNALARAAGTKYAPIVRRAVCRRYPDMCK